MKVYYIVYMQLIASKIEINCFHFDPEYISMSSIAGQKLCEML